MHCGRASMEIFPTIGCLSAAAACYTLTSSPRLSVCVPTHAHNCNRILRVRVLDFDRHPTRTATHDTLCPSPQTLIPHPNPKPQTPNGNPDGEVHASVLLDDAAGVGWDRPVAYGQVLQSRSMLPARDLCLFGPSSPPKPASRIPNPEPRKGGQDSTPYPTPQTQATPDTLTVT